jgi:ribosomal protein S27E
MPDRTFTVISNENGKIHERSISIKKKEAKFGSCKHDSVLVDKDLWNIECADCGEILDPIQYLVNLAGEETLSKFRLDTMQEEYMRIEDVLKKRTHTKCEHCGKSTKITGWTSPDLSDNGLSRDVRC